MAGPFTGAVPAIVVGVTVRLYPMPVQLYRMRGLSLGMGT